MSKHNVFGDLSPVPRGQLSMTENPPQLRVSAEAVLDRMDVQLPIPNGQLSCSLIARAGQDKGSQNHLCEPLNPGADLSQATSGPLQQLARDILLVFLFSYPHSLNQGLCCGIFMPPDNSAKHRTS